MPPVRPIHFKDLKLKNEKMWGPFTHTNYYLAAFRFCGSKHFFLQPKIQSRYKKKNTY